MTEKNSMLIFNLSPELNFQELMELFKSFGEVVRVRSYFIPWKMKTFNCKVWYRDSLNCAKAVEQLNQAELDGQTLKVIFN
jgi:RNA recognition motif-containing protein